MQIEINFTALANDFKAAQLNQLYRNPAFWFSHLIFASRIRNYPNNMTCAMALDLY